MNKIVGIYVVFVNRVTINPINPMKPFTSCPSYDFMYNIYTCNKFKWKKYILIEFFHLINNLIIYGFLRSSIVQFIKLASYQDMNEKINFYIVYKFTLDLAHKEKIKKKIIYVIIIVNCLLDYKYLSFSFCFLFLLCSGITRLCLNKKNKKTLIKRQ